MATLYLHIGLQKTGTTSLQCFLAINDKILQNYNYSYPLFRLNFPDVHKHRNAHFMVARFYNESGKRNHSQEKSVQKEGYAWLLQKLEEKENVILSDESIWYASEYMKDFWENLKVLLENAGHRLKVIVYFRRQDLFVQSYWMHKVRKGETMAFNHYVNKEKYAFCHLDYYSHLESIASVIGRDAILVRVYEKGQYFGNNGTIFSDFLHTVGLELTGGYQFPDNNLNPSLDLICTEIQRIFNTMPGFSDQDKSLLYYMRKVSDYNREHSENVPVVLFSPEEREAFLEKFTLENQMVAKNYLGREDGQLFYEMLSQGQATKSSFTTKEYVQNCGQIILSILEEKNQLSQANQVNRLYRRRIDQLERRFPNNVFSFIKRVSQRLVR